MTQIVKFPVDFYDTGEVKFAAGQYYPLNSETQSLVNTGFAELVGTDDSAVLQARARIAKERAETAMAQALELQSEYDAAQALADAAPVDLPASAKAADSQELI